MIVVAIIGILAAIAIPAYQNYLIRAQISEGPSLIGGLETAFDENYANTGVAAAANATVGVTNPISGTYVSSVLLGPAGQIVVTYGGTQANAAISGKTVNWTAYASANGDITWICNAHPAAAGLTALSTVASAGTITNLAYLPTICQ